MKLMVTIFFKLVKMSIKTSIVGIFIMILLKIFQNKIPYKYRILFWIPFIFLLVVPINIESNYSIYTSIETKLNNLKSNIVNNIDYEDQIKTEDENTKEIKNLKKRDFDNSYKEMTSNEFSMDYVKIFLLVWIFIVIVRFSMFLIIMFSFKKKEKHNYIDDRIKSIFIKCKERLNIKNSFILLLYNSDVRVPSITGLFRPKIMFNDTIYSLSDEQVKCIFLHELTHYIRKDNIFNFLCEILKIIYIFNPIIVILINKLKEDIEYATDDRITRILTKKEKEIYCKSLLIYNEEINIKELSNSNQLRGYSNIISKRIDVIYKKKKCKRIFLIFMFLLLIFSTVCFSASPKTFDREDIEKILEKNTRYNSIYIVQNFMLSDANDYKIRSYYYNDYVFVKNEGNNSLVMINLAKNIYYELNNKKVNSREIFDEEDVINKYRNLIKNSKLSYSYLGRLKYNNKACILISLYNNSKNNFKWYDLIIDLDTGFIQKEEYYLNKENNLKPSEPMSIIDYDYMINQ